MKEQKEDSSRPLAYFFSGWASIFRIIIAVVFTIEYVVIMQYSPHMAWQSKLVLLFFGVILVLVCSVILTIFWNIRYDIDILIDKNIQEKKLSLQRNHPELCDLLDIMDIERRQRERKRKQNTKNIIQNSTLFIITLVLPLVIVRFHWLGF